MFKQIFGYLKAWVRGEEAELHIDKTWHFSWWELVPIIGIIGLIIYWVCR